MKKKMMIYSFTRAELDSHSGDKRKVPISILKIG